MMLYTGLVKSDMEGNRILLYVQNITKQCLSICLLSALEAFDVFELNYLRVHLISLEQGSIYYVAAHASG